MSSEQITSREIAEKNVISYIDDVINGQNYELLNDIMVEECDVIGKDIIMTPDKQQDYLQRMHSAFPDFEVTLEDFWFDETSEMAFFRFIMSGTFENELIINTDDDEKLTFEPTGKSFSIEGIDYGRHGSDGRVVAFGGLIEELDLFIDTGIIPELSEFAA
ncbi:MAG: hypothetical protein ABEI06_08840 [Halobacteriaceae archaeon]